MILSDFHLHTTFSDGANTPEEMVQVAIQKGFTHIGFSDHAYTPFDESCCMAKAAKVDYIQTVSALKSKYADKIAVFCGIEQDYYSTESTDGYDYVIGSVHYVKVGDTYLAVDESKTAFTDAVERYFDGDTLRFAEVYFATVAKVAERTGADMIGHFDLIAKFNDSGLFDTSAPRYIRAWQAAADALLAAGIPFEINTGAISRGYTKHPYPAREIIDYLKARGAKFILSGDAHTAAGIGYQFDRWEGLL